MSKYKFGDTFIKNNQAYIVLDYKDKTYHLQTRCGKLVVRSVDKLDEMVEQRKFVFCAGLCDLKYITAKDLNIGDMIVGRHIGNYSYISKRRIGVVFGKRTIRRSRCYPRGEQLIKIQWLDTQSIETYQFAYLDQFFNKYPFSKYKNPNFSWKHIPAIKQIKNRCVCLTLARFHLVCYSVASPREITRQ